MLDQPLTCDFNKSDHVLAGPALFSPSGAPGTQALSSRFILTEPRQAGGSSLVFRGRNEATADGNSRRLPDMHLTPENVCFLLRAVQKKKPARFGGERSIGTLSVVGGRRVTSTKGKSQD